MWLMPWPPWRTLDPESARRPGRKFPLPLTPQGSSGHLALTLVDASALELTM